MRVLVTGINAAGRSCIVDEQDVAPAPIAGLAGLRTARLWSADQDLPARPQQTGHFVNVQLAPGALRWMVVEHDSHDHDGEPTTAGTMHHSDTLDLIVVLTGSTRLVLDDDERELGPGDCVVMTGVDHALEAGSDGCRMMSFAIGTPAPG